MNGLSDNIYFDIKKIFMLTASALMYAVGGGVAHYFGASILPFDFWLGLLWVMSVHSAGYYLLKKFSQTENGVEKKEINLWFSKKKISILHLSMLFISFSGVYIAILLVNQKITFYLGALMVTTLLGLVVFTIPPFNLSRRGYHEVGMAIFQGCLIPAYGFFLLTNNFHRMLFLIVFPITLLALAFYIALNYSTFASDKKNDRKSLVLLFSWQRAAPIHHVLLISSYLFFLFGYSLGMPISILWMALLPFPLASLQIFWLIRILRGGRPLWSFFILLSASVYGLSAYLIAFTLWIH